MFARMGRLPKIFCLLCIGLCFLGCAKQVASEVIVYSNDFESGNLQAITNGVYGNYNGSKVIGQYNGGGFSIDLNALPAHAIIEVSFDLFIHDSWDGNRIDGARENGPDVWKFLADGTTYINTTFSNSDCGNAVFCDPQSYPGNYLISSNNPKTGAFNKNLPGLCLRAGEPGGTTLYKIVKRIAHDKGTLNLQFLDELVQTNTVDKKCDESWSIDNVIIKAIQQ